MTQQEYKLYDERIRVFINRLKTLIYEKEQALDVKFCKFEPRVPFEQRLDGNYKPIKKDDAWGTNYERGWFHVCGKVPDGWQDKHVCARLDFGGEALLFDKTGTPVSAISLWTMWENYDFHRDRIDIARKAKGNEKIDWWFEASAGQLYGLRLENDYGDLAPKRFGNYQAAFREAVIAVFREDIQQLIYDFGVLYDLMKSLQEKSVRKARIMRALNLAIDSFKSDAKTVAAIRDDIKSVFSKKAEASALTAHAVGHAHIDTAWLWPLEETIRKCARSFSSQLELMDKYPDFIFGASQPQHFVFIKEYYPILYQKIKKRVKEGRFELQGGMWVEADCNLISGESMVRQILHGKNFFMDEFGVEVDNLWLPDVFGYSAALPQILKKSGIEYFVTQKISWNQFNRFPNYTFIWRGIDGSEVITHFPPEDDYNSELKPSQMIKASENFKEKAFLDEFLVLFGIGDGGGGPTEEIIEYGLRQNDLEGSPKVQFGSAADMLHRLDKHKHELAHWVGELYLEYHRGTLTTHAFNKKMNRQLEYKLRQVEMIYTALPLKEFPLMELDEIWKILLINQFHDIIPGSSITPVYERSTKDYQAIQEKADDLIKRAVSHLFIPDKDHLVVFNSLPLTFNGIVELPSNWQGFRVKGDNGIEIKTQQEKDKVIALLQISSLNTITLKRCERISESTAERASDNLILENDLIRYEFDNNGTIKSAYDKEQNMEVLASSARGNVWSLYEDRPINWDAWDIEIYYENQLLETAKVQTILKYADGPLRQGLQISFSIGQSKIQQRVFLENNTKRLDFQTKIDWHEKHKMLRVAFPVNVYAEEATFDIQYGNVKRPTHRNTSWDMAKFEVCAHKYADLSDNQYGVALLNDCKYGHKIFGNIIDLNVLRSPTMPDPKADEGEHRFTYSLLPHKENVVNSIVIEEAHKLNQPPLLFPDYKTQSFSLPLDFESSNVSLEALKKAEKENAWIVRLVEVRGCLTDLDIRLNNKNVKIFETDLLERNLCEISTQDNILKARFKPFEIRTFKIVP